MGLEKCQKFIPRNVMPIKNSFTVTLTLRDTTGCCARHNGMEDWKIAIIDRAENVPELRRRESHWQHSLDKFIPNGLNERFVDITML